MKLQNENPGLHTRNYYLEYGGVVCLRGHGIDNCHELSRSPRTIRMVDKVETLGVDQP